MDHSARNRVSGIIGTPLEVVFDAFPVICLLAIRRIYFFIGAGRLAPVRILACLETDIRSSFLPGYVVIFDFFGTAVSALSALSVTMGMSYENVSAKKNHRLSL
jgi:hypothetical protein